MGNPNLYSQPVYIILARAPIEDFNFLFDNTHINFKSIFWAEIRVVLAPVYQSLFPVQPHLEVGCVSADNASHPHGYLEAGEPQKESKGATNCRDDWVEVIEEELLRYNRVCVVVVDSDAALIDQCLELHKDTLLIRELHVDAWTLALCDLFIEHWQGHIVLKVSNNATKVSVLQALWQPTLLSQEVPHLGKLTDCMRKEFLLELECKNMTNYIPFGHQWASLYLFIAQSSMQLMYSADILVLSQTLPFLE